MGLDQPDEGIRKRPCVARREEQDGVLVLEDRAPSLYTFAKLCKWLDQPIFVALGRVSRHTLKHLIAGAADFWLLRMLRLRAPLTSRPEAFP